MAEMYADYGIVGVVVVLFSGMLYWIRGFFDRLVNNGLIGRFFSSLISKCKCHSVQEN